MSPVFTQPSTMRSAVASGSFQNPFIWPSARPTISPTSPTGSGSFASFQIASSAKGSGMPQARSGLEPSTSANHWRGPIIASGSTSVWP